MVKHRSHNFKSLEGSTSTHNERLVIRQPSASVKDKLHDLRQADPAEAAARKQVLAAAANQPSIPPDVQRLLGVPLSQPPSTPRIRLRDRQRTPGPAPPSSWLRGDVSGASSRSLPRDSQIGASKTKQHGRMNRFKTLHSVDDRVGSLYATALHKLASNWDVLDVTEKQVLQACPQRVRCEMFPYLAYHGIKASSKDFTLLTIGDEEILELDLGGHLGEDGVSLSTLLATMKPAKLKTVEETPVDDWDAVPDVVLPAIPSSNHFQALTHLCLSHPPSTILWRQLLDLTAHTPHLTHLSLAHWPRPTLTPNLLTASVTDNRGHSVDAGGSTFYSDVEAEYFEPILLFRKLSANLLSLQFLDVEGNYRWLPALAMSPSDVSSPRIMTTSWRHLERIHCDAIPANCISKVRQVEGIRHSASAAAVYKSILERSTRNATYILPGSLESWQLAFWASRYISASRRASNAPPIVFEFGDLLSTSAELQAIR